MRSSHFFYKIFSWVLIVSSFFHHDLFGQTEDPSFNPTVSVESAVIVSVKDPVKLRVLDFLQQQEEKSEKDFSGDSCDILSQERYIPEKFIKQIPKFREVHLSFRRVFSSSQGFDQNIVLYEYGFVRNILALSDGRENKGMAEKLSTKFPGAKIIKTDLYTHDELEQSSGKNILKIFMSNTEAFPLPDNAFELIVLKSGICECTSDKNKSMCCGPAVTPEGRLTFLKEVVRVLNKNVVHSVALLHANEEMPSLSNQSVAEWLDVFEVMKGLYGDRLSFQLWTIAKETHGVMVRVEKK